ncbi:MAG: tetratricopeptide repeat protein [Chloroflexota bacterium]|nr:MAG: hypothetical protein DIU68_00550 [Chloroflexota bacterium]
MSQDVQALFREGVAEARLGNRKAARELFEKVVALDPKHEKGWLWLASVAGSDEDQKQYLQRVLELNPNNERAQRALEKLLAREKTTTAAQEEIAPGVSRRSVAVVAGAAILAVIVVIVALIVLVIGNNRQRADAQATQAAVMALTTAHEQAQIDAQTATMDAVLALTPTATETPHRTPIPTWTPTPTETPFAVVATALPPPSGLQGRIAGWSGRDIMSSGFLPVGYYDLATGAFTAVSGTTGRDVRVHPSGQRLVYTRYNQSTFANMVESVNLNGADAQSLIERLGGQSGLLDAQMPDYSPDGSRIVFIATSPNTRTPQVFMLDLNAPADASVPRQLTTDSASYRDPAISPDGRLVAVVRDDESGPTPGADIVIIDIETLEQRALTADFGTFTESSPRWSPDGFQIAYAAAPANAPDNSDIAIRPAAGYGTPMLLARDPANDIYPVFSPDGMQLAFASNRGGQYDIYIVDLATQALWQLTNSPEDDYPGAWWQTGP